MYKLYQKIANIDIVRKITQRKEIKQSFFYESNRK